MSTATRTRTLLGKAWRTYRRSRHRWERQLNNLRPAPEGYRTVHVNGRVRHGRVVEHFDSVAAGSETAALLHQALNAANVPHVVLPQPPLAAASIAVSGDDIDAFHAAFQTLASAGPEWLFQPDGTRRTRQLSRWAKSRCMAPARYTILRLLVTDSGLVLSGPAEGVVVEVWSTPKQMGAVCECGEAHVAGTLVAPSPITAVPCLAPATWAASVKRAGNWPEPVGKPHLLDVTDPIDVVYTWVDGGDQDWIRRRDDALDQDPALRHETATSKSRFTSRDELRYSLRSLEMYANWVRRIHLVTDRQVPDWLDANHPKINIVDHQDIFSDPSVLPVFNSHAIESQLHHISGLSDRYLYMNDDVFFGRPVRPELFFEGNGLTRFFNSAYALGTNPPSAQDVPALAAAKNNRAFVEDRFGRTVTHRFRHTPHPQNRLVLDEMEERFPELFTRVAQSRFRAPADYSIASSLHHYYAYATGRAVPGTLRALYRDIANLRSPQDLERVFRPPGHDVFCLNDVHVTTLATENRAFALVQGFLQECFPLKSTFEK